MHHNGLMSPPRVQARGNGHNSGGVTDAAPDLAAGIEAARPRDDLAVPSAFPPIADYGFLSDCESRH
jgi:hypothetical protein